MNDPKKTSVPVCCICQKVINGDAADRDGIVHA